MLRRPILTGAWVKAFETSNQHGWKRISPNPQPEPEPEPEPTETIVIDGITYYYNDTEEKAEEKAEYLTRAVAFEFGQAKTLSKMKTIRVFCYSNCHDTYTKEIRMDIFVLTSLNTKMSLICSTLPCNLKRILQVNQYS